MIQENRESMIRVRDIHKRYAQQVEGSLTGEMAEKFKMEFKRASFPAIYRERQTGRVIGAAEKFEDLSADQKSSLAAIKETYNRDAAALAQRAETAQIEQENSFSFRKMMEGGMFGGGGQANDGMREMAEQRRTLEDATYDKIKALLSPEQVAKLPERRDEGGRGGDGGGQQRMNRNRNRDEGGDNAQPGRRTRPQGETPPPQ